MIKKNSSPKKINQSPKFHINPPDLEVPLRTAKRKQFHFSFPYCPYFTFRISECSSKEEEPSKVMAIKKISYRLSYTQTQQKKNNIKIYNKQHAMSIDVNFNSPQRCWSYFQFFLFFVSVRLDLRFEDEDLFCNLICDGDDFIFGGFGAVFGLEGLIRGLRRWIRIRKRWKFNFTR